MYPLLKSKLVKNLESCKHANILFILGISTKVTTTENLFPSMVGSWALNFL